MEAGEDQTNSSSANSSAASGGNSRPPQIAQMSLYERQAVQALQALQRQPNAAQYFQQLMLQQQINSAQLHNLAAVQQATLAASRQSSSPSNSVSQASSAQGTVNLSTTSGGGTITNPRPVGPATSATSTALSQSVLLGGNSGGQGQMYLRVNRSLRAPLTPQLIFMPGGTATAAVATVAQQQQSQQQQETVPTSSSNQPDNDQVQNLAMRCVSTPRVATVKTEFADRKETSGSFPLNQQTQQQFGQSAQQIQPQTQPLANTKLQNCSNATNPSVPGLNVKGANQSAVNPQQAGGSSNPSSSSPTPSLPLSQLLLSQSGLCQARGVPAATATVTHILVPTSNVPTSSQGYPMGTVATKSNLTAQTLVVQPLQQTGANLSTEKLAHGTGHVPIQPKTAQGHRLPVQMPPRHPPPILPAPPNNGQAMGGHHPPHVPVQLVGARQSALGNSQALAVAQARTCCAQQDATAVMPVNNVVTMVTAVETGGAGMCLKTAQSALPMSPMQTNQSPALSQGNPASVTHSMDGQNNSGDSVFIQYGPAQTKTGIAPLKRKSESDLPHEMSAEAVNASPSMQDSAPPLSPAPSLDTVPEMAFSSPPTLSLSLPLPRGGGQGDRAPVPQAVVKPQVLTHLIEGFVIQEGAEPFPVTGPVKELPVAVPPILHPENIRSDKLKCEYCLRFAPANQFRRSKRFCSKTCAKRGLEGVERPPGAPAVQDVIARRRGPRRSSSEIACAKITGRHLPVKCRSESSRSEDISSCEGEEEEDFLSLSPGSSFSCPRPTHYGPQLDDTAPSGLPVDENHFLSGNPSHWSVEEVCQFISSLQGCEDLASQFLSQEIDGQALMLLKEEHLMSTMNIKLGPALKICASINSLKD
ncbi:polyhomeotic-like protein 1 isoform X3 [Carassius carassius]|uniref:polyhomeotic-like protein 1 isoform X3 n=1 Tax=Carassius carassius TaxID=217509 RepID=UPI0028689DF9|nr:polyhomeotic-like protein 1 isoform X3 [Carassius carassius]